MASNGQSYVTAVEATDSVEVVVEQVRGALSNPAVLFYGALLSHNKTQRLLCESSSAEHKALAQLLDIMAYGTVKDLNRSTLSTSSAGDLVTPNLIERLQQLSLLSYCATSSRESTAIGYDDLEQYLEMADDDALEAVVRNAVSHRLLKARLDPQRRCLYAEEFAARCVRPKDITALKVKLQQWLGAVDTQLNELQGAKQRCTTSTAR